MYKNSRENVDLEVTVTILQNLCHPYCKKKEKKNAKKGKPLLGRSALSAKISVRSLFGWYYMRSV